MMRFVRPLYRKQKAENSAIALFVLLMFVCGTRPSRTGFLLRPQRCPQRLPKNSPKGFEQRLLQQLPQRCPQRAQRGSLQRLPQRCPKSSPEGAEHRLRAAPPQGARRGSPKAPPGVPQKLSGRRRAEAPPTTPAEGPKRLPSKAPSKGSRRDAGLKRTADFLLFFCYFLQVGRWNAMNRCRCNALQRGGWEFGGESGKWIKEKHLCRCKCLIFSW